MCGSTSTSLGLRAFPETTVIGHNDNNVARMIGVVILSCNLEEKNSPCSCSQYLVSLRLGKETQHAREDQRAHKQDTNADGVCSAGFESDSQIIENPNRPNK